jgi:hypothetical protein
MKRLCERSLEMPKTPDDCPARFKIHILTLARKNAISAPPHARRAVAAAIISLTRPPSS